MYNIYHVGGEVVLDAVAEDLVAAAPAPTQHHAAGLRVERHRPRPGHRHSLLLDLDRAHLQTFELAKILSYDLYIGVPILHLFPAFINEKPV